MTSELMLLDWCYSNENMSGACVYISIVGILTAIHILACIILNFAEKSEPERSHNAAAHSSICTLS